MSVERIADALSRVQRIAKKNEGNILRSMQITRQDRELLVRTKWLQEIIKGWYLLIKPDISYGDSTIWYSNFWDFLRVYLQYNYKKKHCLSAENSLDLHTGSPVIPKQVIVITERGGGAPQDLPFDTSIFVYADPNNLPEEREERFGLQIMTLACALCRVSPSYFQKNPRDAEIALRLVRTSSELTQVILKYNLRSQAARLIGAYEFIGEKHFAEELSYDLAVVGWKVKGENPFLNAMPLLSEIRLKSPHAARIISLWNEYREVVISCFPKAPGLPKNHEKYLSQIEDLYEKDAYNSLSIEGYRVDEDLVARVKNNQWEPSVHIADLEERNALSARGYYEAFLEVKKSILRIFQGGDSGEVAERDLKKWYQNLFAPMARTGLIPEVDLFGYRKNPVYIRNSRHVPLPKEALLDAMDAFFDCLKKESHPAVRAVLGHYIFVYIHPFMDGNGRLGRFLMNVMLASGGYPWTIVHVKNRIPYLDALEKVGVERNIEPFAKFIVIEMKAKAD